MPQQVHSVLLDGRQPDGDVGHFRYDATGDRWSWSEGFYAIHGYVPGEVPATTAVLLSHKHPEDRERAAAILDRVLDRGGSFSHYHRVVDLHERVRSVLSVGHGLLDDDGRVERVEGFMVDLTAARRNETEAEVQTHLARIAEHRAVIDQAKGMVMLATGCEGEVAFDHLRQCSQHANLKLHEVARRLVQTVEAGGQATDQRTDLVLEVLADIVASSRRAASSRRRRGAAGSAAAVDQGPQGGEADRHEHASRETDGRAERARVEVLHAPQVPARGRPTPR